MICWLIAGAIWLALSLVCAIGLGRALRGLGETRD